jgi:hypothetical protein
MFFGVTGGVSQRKATSLGSRLRLSIGNDDQDGGLFHANNS